MTTDPYPYALQITEANHKDDAFWTMDGAAFATQEERDGEYAKVPSIPNDDKADVQYTLDKLDAEGSLVEEKFISRAAAEALTGRKVEAMRAESKARLAEVVERVQATAP